MKYILLLLALSMSRVALAVEPAVFRLTHVPHFFKSSADFPDHEGGEWSVVKSVLRGGKQEGTERIVVNNGKLAFAVCPTRGMSIVTLHVIGEDFYPIGWQSPVKETVHPTWIDLESRGGLGWLDGFNEWMVRCGLEFAGHPGMDSFTTNTGDKGEMPLTLHGKIGNTPASEVELIIEREAPYRIRLRGTVYERSFHGPKLKMVSEISTVPGSWTIEVKDQVTNEGSAPQEHQLIYHTNYGDPILEKGAKVVGAFKTLQPMNDHAAKFVKTWDTCDAPTDNFVEQVYLAEAAADDAGRSTMMLHNADASRGASIAWDVRELPYVTVWKNTASKAEGYVTGLEPGTSFPFNRRIERQFDRVPKLGAGQTREFNVTFTVHPDARSVAATREAIEKLQAANELKVIPTPPVIPGSE